MTPRKIITYFEDPYFEDPCTPQPPFWVAYYDGDEGEEDAPRGFGSTQKDAIKDLTEQWPEDEQ